MYIKIRLDGKLRKVSVRGDECKKLKCFVPSCGNSPGEYYCRIREVAGCPINKEAK